MATPAVEQLWAKTAPAFSDTSSSLYVRFPVRRFRNARIAWLNDRWLRAIGGGGDGDRTAIERWLLDWFGVAVPSDDDPPEQFGSGEHHLYADRYGAPTGAAHGGSGRVGTLGGFNAKGIGRTPLVSTTSDWYHSHGCMFLEEAVREAILSEVAAIHCPHGAIPTIAVIDVGARLRWDDGTFGARRAVIVRPAFLRLASLMRSIYFGNSGHADSDQAIDARRVADLWRTVTSDSLSACFLAMGEQYGFCHALRLWPGPIFASNIELSGRLVDFGSFRALPSWRRARGDARAHGFGTETTLATATARSLARNGLRHGQTIDPNALVDRYRAGVDSGYRDALLRYNIRSGSPDAARIEAVRACQQRETTDLTGGTSTGTVIAGLRPWSTLYRETLLAETEAMIATLGDGPVGNLTSVREFIERQVSIADPARGGNGDPTDTLLPTKQAREAGSASVDVKIVGAPAG